MKKILVLSYFFPPCNLTASQRIEGWVNYLSLFGYYPIVVTRNWDIAINSPEDASISTGKEVKQVKQNNYEVHYLPYNASKRDEIFEKNRNKKYLQKLSKILTLKDLLLESSSNLAIPYANMYDYSRKIIKENPDIECAIISAKPFNQFKFGYLLNKEFGIKWIADYRDDWNTSELESKNTGWMKYISKIQSKNEKKWIGSAECITSVSKIYRDRITQFVQKKGFVILNGFDGIENTEIIKKDNNRFNITYNGSLYPTQSIEPILDTVKKIIQQKEFQIEIHLNFPGLGFDKTQEKRVIDFMKGFEQFVHITSRIPKSEVVYIQKNSDLLLMVAHGTVKGVPSSKLYEYVGLKKQILLFPNDHDIIEETLNDTGLGIICDTEDQIYDHLVSLIRLKEKGEIEVLVIDDSKIDFYSRKNQTAELAKLLDELLENK